jgi:hypothetical protein
VQSRKRGRRLKEQPDDSEESEKSLSFEAFTLIESVGDMLSSNVKNRKHYNLRQSLQKKTESNKEIIFDSPINIGGRKLRKVEPLLLAEPIAMQSLNSTSDMKFDSFVHDFPIYSVAELNETKLKHWFKTFSLRLDKAGSDVARVRNLFRDPELLLYLKGRYIDDASLTKLCYGLRISPHSIVDKELNLPSFTLQVEKLKCLINEMHSL